MFLRRWGITGCLSVAQLAYMCRFLWYAALPLLVDLASSQLGISRDLALWFFLPSEVLHGLTCALLWSTVVQFASNSAPEGMQSTSISLVQTVHWMLGFGTGASIAGMLFSQIGGQNAFKVSAAFALGTFCLCIVGGLAYGKRWSSSSKAEQKRE